MTGASSYVFNGLQLSQAAGYNLNMNGTSDLIALTGSTLQQTGSARQYHHRIAQRRQ